MKLKYIVMILIPISLLIFLIILPLTIKWPFSYTKSLPPPPAGKCSNNGIWDSSTKKCICSSGYDGKNCEVKCKSKDIVCKDRQCGQICGYDCGTCVLGTCDSKGKCAQCEKDGDCPANEQCDLQTNKCICKDIWTGDNCTISKCGGTIQCSGHGTCAKASDGTYKCTCTAPPRINLLVVLDRKGMETYALGKTGKENQMELLSFLHKQMQNHPTYVKGM
jgi:hypothetical protein